MARRITKVMATSTAGGPAWVLAQSMTAAAVR